MKHATFHFHAELVDFLPREERVGPLTHAFNWRASVKDMVEALGPPHAEIELLVVNSMPETFEYIVADGDRIDVYPHDGTVELPDRVRLRPPLPRPPRFVLDVHLGRLAAYLRMLGFDTLYGDTHDHAGDFDDAELARIAGEEDRVLLTRDTGLLKRNMVTYGYWLRTTDPRSRLQEVVERFALHKDAALFTRCMKCNGLLQSVDKAAVIDQLKPDTIRYFDTFHQCAACGQVYWRGSHYERLQELIDEVLIRNKSGR